MNTLHDLVSKSLDIEIVKSSMNSMYSTVMALPYCTYSTACVVGSTVQSIGGTVSDTAGKVNGTVHDAVSRTVHGTASMIKGTADMVNGTVNSIGCAANNTVHSFVGKVNETIENVLGARRYVPQLKLFGYQNGTIKEEDEDDDDECPMAASNGHISNGHISNGHITSNGHSNGHISNGYGPRGHAIECLDKKLKPVSFEWSGMARDKVSITGSFYDWKTKLPLNKRSKKFAAQIELPNGRHEFKFIVNGVWKHSINYPTVKNDFGDYNNYVEVH